jgi:solute carrier family 31 (copper transporter), member 1
MDHGDMDMGGQCNMNVCCLTSPLRPSAYSVLIKVQMLFTWSSHNLCIVFRQWRVTGPLSLMLSLIAVALLTAGYECVRQISRKYEQSHEARMNVFMTTASSMSRISSPFPMAEHR